MVETGQRLESLETRPDSSLGAYDGMAMKFLSAMIEKSRRRSETGVA